LGRFPSIVADVMSSPIQTVDGETNVRDAALLMTVRRIGSIIVTTRGEAVGIVTERDMLERVVSRCRDPCQVRVKEIMSKPLITVTKDAGILEAMRKIREKEIGRLVVMDNGELIGVISEKDIIRAVSISSLSSFSTLLGRRVT
jgi:CBS domain-containing protein